MRKRSHRKRLTPKTMITRFEKVFKPIGLKNRTIQLLLETNVAKILEDTV